MKPKLLTIFCVLLCVYTKAEQLNPGMELQFMTEQAPPFNYKENGEIKGLAVEVLDALLLEMHSATTSKNVQVLPWARAFGNVQKPGQMNVLFATARTPEREALFKWVGPIVDAKFVIWAPKNSKIKITDPEDLKKHTYVVVRDDAADHLLVARAVPEANIFRVSSFDLMPKMLALNRVEFLAYDETGARFHFRELKIPTEQYKSIFTLSKSLQYFAFNKSIPDPIVNQYQAAFDRISKKIEKIKSQY